MRRGLVAGLGSLLALAFLAGSPESGRAAPPPSYVVMYSDGDWVGSGVHRLFHPGNGSVAVSGTPAYLSVGASGGTFGDSFSLTFAAPPGQSLVPGGVYVDAQRAPFREAGRPGIDISGDGRGCNTSPVSSR